MHTPAGFEPIDTLLLSRYVAEDCSASEREQVELWLAGHPSHKGLEAGLRGVTLGDTRIAHSELDTAWTRFYDSIKTPRGGLQSPTVLQLPKAARKKNYGPNTNDLGGSARADYGHILRSWTVYAAGCFVLMLAIIGVKYLPVTSSEPQSKTYITQPGQRALITLADGSQAILAPSTKLVVTDANKRIVNLTGEAVFTVIDHAREPFTVRAGNSVTRVLGTTFGIRAYQGDGVVRVAVAEGKVSVQDGKVLSIGEAARVTGGGAVITDKDVNVTAMLGWTQGKLVFDGVPFGEMIEDLDRWYGLNISIRNASLARRPVIAEFEKQPVDEVLKALASILDAQYEKQGTHIVFSISGNNNEQP